MKLSSNHSEVSAQAITSGIVSLAASMAIALLNALPGNSALLGNLPGTVQFVLLAAIPPLITFLGTYAAKPVK